MAGSLFADMAKHQANFQLPAGWIEDACRNREGKKVFLDWRDPMSMSVGRFWHTWFTGIYRVTTTPAGIWCSGGTGAQCAAHLEIRPKPWHHLVPIAKGVRRMVDKTPSTGRHVRFKALIVATRHWRASLQTWWRLENPANGNGLTPRAPMSHIESNPYESPEATVSGQTPPTTRRLIAIAGIAVLVLANLAVAGPLAFFFWLNGAWMIDDSLAFSLAPTGWVAIAVQRAIPGLAAALVVGFLSAIANRTAFQHLNSSKAPPRWLVAAAPGWIIALGTIAGSIQFVIDRPYI